MLKYFWCQAGLYARVFTCVILFIVEISNLTGQDFLDTIAIASCHCVDEYVANNVDGMSSVQFGICIIDEATPYSKNLMERYDIDMSTIEGESARQLGELVAVRMLKYCPDHLIALSEERDEESTLKVEGSIKDIINSQFNILVVSEDTGRSYSMLWLHDFKGSEMLLRAKEHLIGMQVLIEYREQEFFDPQIQEYRKYKVITGLQIP